jgi:hypothetical protein
MQNSLSFNRPLLRELQRNISKQVFLAVSCDHPGQKHESFTEDTLRKEHTACAHLNVRLYQSHFDICQNRQAKAGADLISLAMHVSPLSTRVASLFSLLVLGIAADTSFGELGAEISKLIEKYRYEPNATHIHRLSSLQSLSRPCLFVSSSPPISGPVCCGQWHLRGTQVWAISPIYVST